MFGFIFWIFFIFIIWSIVTKNSGTNTSSRTNNDKYKPINSHYDDPGMRKMKEQENNSYYSKEKVASYRRMEAAHIGHEDDEDLDLSSTIGYVKCPKCGAAVSKKSEVCFMCDAPLK